MNSIGSRLLLALTVTRYIYRSKPTTFVVIQWCLCKCN